MSLNPKFDLDRFFEQLAHSRSSLLLLDYDGTLAPFVVDPRQALPFEGVTQRVNAIMRSGRTRVIIISGRALNDLVPLLPFNPLPEVWGCHGAERMISLTRTYVRQPISENAHAGLETARKMIQNTKLPLRCEYKPVSIAVHWRGLEKGQQEIMRQDLVELLRPLEKDTGLEMHAFDGGLELRVRGINKGKVIQTLLSESDPQTVIAYLGDDATDEEAFAALGERGLKVLVRSDPQPTLADICIAPPEELYDFLERWEQTLNV